jgi:hypothetical protein
MFASRPWAGGAVLVPRDWRSRRAVACSGARGDRAALGVLPRRQLLRLRRSPLGTPRTRRAPAAPACVPGAARAILTRRRVRAGGEDPHVGGGEAAGGGAAEPHGADGRAEPPGHDLVRAAELRAGAGLAGGVDGDARRGGLGRRGLAWRAAADDDALPDGAGAPALGGGGGGGGAVPADAGPAGAGGAGARAGRVGQERDPALGLLPGRGAGALRRALPPSRLPRAARSPRTRAGTSRGAGPSSTSAASARAARRSRGAPAARRARARPQSSASRGWSSTSPQGSRTRSAGVGSRTTHRRWT